MRVLFLGWILLCAGLFPINLFAQAPIGKISTIRPAKEYTLMLLRKDKLVPKTGTNTPLLVGDVLITGPKTQVIVRFEDGNTLLIRQSSKITIEQYEFNKKGSIKTEGLIHGLIDQSYEGNAESYFEFTSSSAIAGVRGTIVGIFVQPQTGQLLAYLQEASHPAYVRSPASQELTNFQPNTVAGGSDKVGFQVVPFDPQVHGMLQLPKEVIESIHTKSPETIDLPEEAGAETPEGESSGANTAFDLGQASGDDPSLTTEAPGTSSAEADLSGASLFPTLIGGPGTISGGSLTALFIDMRNRTVDTGQLGSLASLTTQTSDPTRNLQKQLESFTQKLEEFLRQEQERLSQLKTTKVRVNVTF